MIVADGARPVASRRLIYGRSAMLQLDAVDQDKNAGTIDPQVLLDLVSMKMPFGRYKGRTLCDLPETYLVWFHQKGFPPGKLGILLSTLYEIKLNGLESLLRHIRKDMTDAY
jgi:uncharacterized protein